MTSQSIHGRGGRLVQLKICTKLSTFIFFGFRLLPAVSNPICIYFKSPVNFQANPRNFLRTFESKFKPIRDAINS